MKRVISNRKFFYLSQDSVFEHCSKITANNKLGFVVIVLTWLLFSYPFFLLGKTTYPSDYQLNFFQPWSQYPGMGSPVKNNAQPDIVTQIYPWKVFTIEQFKKGALPLWNPYSFAGTPHLANYQSAVLSPINLLYFLPIKFIHVWTLTVIIQPLLAGLFTYILSRQQKISVLGSTLSSVSFMFCGFMTAWMGYQTLDYAILFLPLSIWLLEKYFVSKHLKWLSLFSLSIFLSFVSGHFQTSIYFVLAIFIFIVYKAFLVRKIRFFLTPILYLCFGFLLAMPQILPSIELYINSVRSNIFQKIEAIPLRYIPSIFAPDFFGNPVTRNDWFGHYAEWSSYAGSLTLLLSIFAIFSKNRKILYFLVLLVVSFFLAFDTPILNLLVNLKIPVLSTSAASRVIVLFSFSISILGGIGFDELFFNKHKRRLVFFWIGIVLSIILVLVISTLVNIMDFDKSLLARKNLFFPVISSTFLIILIVVARLKKKYLYFSMILIVVLSIFEMHRFSTKWQNFSESKNVYKNVPIEKFYRNIKETDRVIGLSGAEDSLYYKVPILTGYDPLYISSYGSFIKSVNNGKKEQADRSVVSFPLNGEYTSQAMNLLGVNYVVHKVSDKNYSWAFPFKKYQAGRFEKIYDDKYYQVFKNTESMPRAFLVNKVKYYPDDDLLRNIFKLDYSNTAFISEKANEISSSGPANLRITDYEPDSVTLQVNATEPKFLVLMDNYYPGWKATLNGNATKIYRTDYQFRGVFVPKGSSILKLKYVPQSFYNGLYLTLIGILGIIIMSILSFINKNE